MAFTIQSSSFQENRAIPIRYTQDGDNLSPELSWAGAPQGTQSLALIVDDPDAPDPAAPKKTYVHWVLFNIPPAVTGLAEGCTADALPGATRSGRNDAKSSEYVGPAPPRGRHRYFFKLYALDTTLELADPSKKDLEVAMKGHVLGQAQVVGTYQRAASEAA